MMSERNERLPIPTHTSKKLVFKVAEDFARAVQFGVGDPVEPLVARLRGSISYKGNVQLIGGVPESIKVVSPSNFTIFLPVDTSRERDRFTICHELGHLFLHYPVVQKQHGAESCMVATRWVDNSNLELQRTEWEANWFAAGFLMPETDFRKLFLDCGRNIVKVANYFGVTEKAAEVRAKTLGI